MLKPKKKWGQNFLRNPRAARDIAAAIEPAADELVLEIGPGDGALTRELVALGRPLRAIEIDPELAARLRRAFPDTLELVEGDATDAPLPDVPFRVAGNLPYNVATPIVRRVITHPLCRRAVFMLQKEVVDKILAKPSDEEYGYLSLFVRIWADSRLLFTNLPSRGALRVYTVSGQFVQQITWEGDDLEGDGDLFWDMKTREGIDIASGLYLWVVTAPTDPSNANSGTIQARGKFVVIRGDSR